MIRAFSLTRSNRVGNRTRTPRFCSVGPPVFINVEPEARISAALLRKNVRPALVGSRAKQDLI